MNTLKTLIVGCALCVLFVNASVAQDANELLKQIDANLMPPSYESYRKIINIEPDGKQQEFVFYTVKKGTDKMALLYLEPASDKGRAALRLGDDMWIYIPNVGKPIRTTSSQSLTGGIFNNGDILLLEYHVEYTAEYLEQTADAAVLTLKARTKAVTYDSLKMWVTLNPLTVAKIECYSASGMLLKTLEFKEMKDFGNGLVRPAVIETTSPLHKNYKAIMIHAGIKAREFEDEVFTLNYLPKLQELR